MMVEIAVICRNLIWCSAAGEGLMFSMNKNTAIMLKYGIRYGCTIFIYLTCLIPEMCAFSRLIQIYSNYFNNVGYFIVSHLSGYLVINAKFVIALCSDDLFK